MIKTDNIPRFAQAFYKKYARATKLFCNIYGVTIRYITRKYLAEYQFKSPKPDYYPWQYLKEAIKFIDRTTRLPGPKWESKIWLKKIQEHMEEFINRHH